MNANIRVELELLLLEAECRQFLIEAEKKDTGSKSDAKKATAVLNKALNPQALLSDLTGDMEEIAKKPDPQSKKGDLDEDFGLVTGAGLLLAAPKVVEVTGKIINWIANRIRETIGMLRQGNWQGNPEGFIEYIGKKWHDLYIKAIAWLVGKAFPKLDKKTRKKYAKRVFMVLVAIFAGLAAKGAWHAYQNADKLMVGLEGALSAVKNGEIGTYLIEAFAETASLVTNAGETVSAVSVAADLDSVINSLDVMKDLIHGLDETCTMATGDVGGASGGLGKKAEVYDTWNQKSLEETNMNKLKITKGRLRKIIAEEVARHNGPRLNEMGAKEEEAEASEEASETDAAQYMTQAEGVIGEDHRDEEDWEAHFKGGAEDDWSQIHKLEKDARYDARQGRELRGDRKDARTRMSVSAAEDEWHSDEHETLADRKYADSLREQVKETLEEMLSDEPVEEAYQGAKSKPTKQAWGKPTPSEKKVEKEKDRKAGKKQAKLNEAEVNWTKTDLLKHLSNNNSVSAADLKYAFKGSSQANSAALAKLADEGILVKTGKRYKLAPKDKK